MLAKKLEKYRIILASSSPRRQQFLKDLDLDFISKSIDVEEIFPDTLKAHEITDFLSNLKSEPFKAIIEENDIVITSDTIVWLNDKALGKPVDKLEAFTMLKSLSNKTHQVITSVCITTSTSKIIFNDTTEVTFKELSYDEIHYYIDNYKPFDKSGAYGIQEWIGKIGVIGLKGSYFNVMGLPVDKLYNELSKIANKTI